MSKSVEQECAKAHVLIDGNPVELKGEQYEPSNGTEGACFQEQWCCNCQRDKCMNGSKDVDECSDEDFCDVLGRSFSGEAPEWRELENGECVCLAFVPMGEAIAQRCTATADLFGGATA